MIISATFVHSAAFNILHDTFYFCALVKDCLDSGAEVFDFTPKFAKHSTALTLSSKYPVTISVCNYFVNITILLFSFLFVVVVQCVLFFFGQYKVNSGVHSFMKSRATFAVLRYCQHSLNAITCKLLPKALYPCAASAVRCVGFSLLFSIYNDVFTNTVLEFRTIRHCDSRYAVDVFYFAVRERRSDFRFYFFFCTLYCFRRYGVLSIASLLAALIQRFFNFR